MGAYDRWQSVEVSTSTMNEGKKTYMPIASSRQKNER